MQDLEALEDRIGALEDDFPVTESDVAALEPSEAEEDPATTVPDLIGQTVTVSGEVTTVVDDHSFVIGGDGVTDSVEIDPFWSDGLLVVSADQSTVAEGDVVQVVGTVGLYDSESFETELAVDLDDALYDDLEQVVAVKAESVTHSVATGG